MALGQFKVKCGTLAKYNENKTANTLDESTLYFLTDTFEIYKGADKYCQPVEVVAEFPTTPAQGKLYINKDTFEAKIWDGTAWIVISPMVSTTIDADTDGNTMATVDAIKSYVATQVADAKLTWLAI